MGCVPSKEGKEGKGSKEVFDDAPVHSKSGSQKTKAVKVTNPANHKTFSRWKPAVEAPVEVAGLEKVKEGKERASVVLSRPARPERPSPKESDEVVDRRATELYGVGKRISQKQLFTQSGWSPQQQPQIDPHQYQTNQYGDAHPQAPPVSQKYLSVSYNPTYEPDPGMLRLASPDDQSAYCYNKTATAASEERGQANVCPAALAPENVDNLGSSRSKIDSSRSRSTESSCEPPRLSTSSRLIDLSLERSLDRSTGVPSSSSITQLYRNVSPKAPGVQTIYQDESIKVRDRANVSQHKVIPRTMDSIKLLHLDGMSEGSVESNYMDISRRSFDGYDFMSVDSLEECNAIIAPAPSLKTVSSYESTQYSDDSSNADAALYENTPQIRNRTQSKTTSTRPHPGGLVDLPEKSANDESYHFLEEIGRGSSAVVMRAEDAGEEVAVKMFDIRNESIKSDLKIKLLSVVSKEIFILRTIQHSSIVKFRKASAEGTHRYLELELCEGGDLQADLLRRGRYSEDMARVMYRQILCALEVLHANKVVHNDVKLENLLLKTSGDARSVKLVDFGLAHLTDLDSPYNYLVGTFEYMPPEVIKLCREDDLTLKRAVRPACSMDMWSAGVVLFMMLGGYNPFRGASTKHVFESIVHGDVDLEAPVWRTVSEPAKDLISKLLRKNPAERLTAWDALQHPWFGPSCPPQSTQQPALFRGIQMRRFKRTVWAIVVLRLLSKKMLLDRMVAHILYRSPFPVSPATYLPENFDRAAAKLFTQSCNLLPKNAAIVDRASPCTQCKVLTECKVSTNGNQIHRRSPCLGKSEKSLLAIVVAAL